MIFKNQAISEVKDLEGDKHVCIHLTPSTSWFKGDVAKVMHQATFEEPIRITASFVSTKDIPFIYASRKEKGSFNVIDNRGECYLLLNNVEQIEWARDLWEFYLVSDIENQCSNLNTFLEEFSEVEEWREKQWT